MKKKIMVLALATLSVLALAACTEEPFTCDLCGEENIYDEEMCSHICHSDHWFWRFIWTIGNFIHSLLGISPVCECGEAHY